MKKLLLLMTMFVSLNSVFLTGIVTESENTGDISYASIPEEGNDVPDVYGLDDEMQNN